jgi:hypothetical protein
MLETNIALLVLMFLLPVYLFASVSRHIPYFASFQAIFLCLIVGILQLVVGSTFFATLWFVNAILFCYTLTQERKTIQLGKKVKESQEGLTNCMRTASRLYRRLDKEGPSPELAEEFEKLRELMDSLLKDTDGNKKKKT